MALVHPDEISLEAFGVAANRRFFVVDEDGRRYGQIRNGTLVRIRPEYDETSGALTLRFPDGTVVDGVPQLGEAIVTDFYGRPVPRARRRRARGRRRSPASSVRPLRLVRSDEPGAGVDRGLGTVTMLSDASLDALARAGGRGRRRRRAGSGC